jgi:hypothetical protein
MLHNHGVSLNCECFLGINENCDQWRFSHAAYIPNMSL